MGHQPRRESVTPAEATPGAASAATRVMAPATRRARRNGGRRATMARPPWQSCQCADLAYGPEHGSSWTHRPRGRRRPYRRASPGRRSADRHPRPLARALAAALRDGRRPGHLVARAAAEPALEHDPACLALHLPGVAERRVGLDRDRLRDHRVELVALEPG